MGGQANRQRGPTTHLPHPTCYIDMRPKASSPGPPIYFHQVPGAFITFLVLGAMATSKNKLAASALTALEPNRL